MCSFEEFTNSIDFENIPISALQNPTCSLLSQSLNAKKVLTAENNCQRDWRGFAHLAGVNLCNIQILNPDPMLEVLKLWSLNQKVSFQDLLDILGCIDRWDVADDVITILTEDAWNYINTKSKHIGKCSSINFDNDNEEITFPLENYYVKPEVENKDGRISSAEVVSPPIIEHNNHQEIETNQNNIITRSDLDRAEQNLPPLIYDAFVLFAEADSNFAHELVHRMEDDAALKFVLCLKDRDILGGISFEYDALLGLIKERCNRLIIIVSKAFLCSSLNSFIVQYAAVLQIEKGCRKIIPCLYEDCELPKVLHCFSCLKYYQAGVFFDFWNRLSDSIRAGRLQYSKNNKISETNEINRNENRNLDQNTTSGIQNETSSTLRPTANIEALDIRNDEVEEVQNSNSNTKSKKWYKRIRRKMCF